MRFVDGNNQQLSLRLLQRITNFFKQTMGKSLADATIDTLMYYEYITDI